jgi:hypothetical protein
MAFVAAHQMGLFSDEDDEEGEAAEAAYFDAAGEAMERDIASGAYVPHVDDGSGVLIHADGTPLTDDEIAEQEAAELHGEEDDDGEDALPYVEEATV